MRSISSNRGPANNLAAESVLVSEQPDRCV